MRIRLTEKKIRGIAASGTPIDILHEKTPSAGLRVSTLGAKIWFYIYRSPVVRDAHGQAKQRRAYLGYHLWTALPLGACWGNPKVVPRRW